MAFVWNRNRPKKKLKPSQLLKAQAQEDLSLIKPAKQT